MSCPRRDEILAVGALDDPERADHVRGCDDCRARLAHLEHTFATLRSAEVGLDGPSRARVWQQLDAARAPTAGLRWPWLVAVPTAAAALTLWVLTAVPGAPEPPEAPRVVAGALRPTQGDVLPPGALPRDTWLEASEGLVLRVASARLSAEAGARLSLAPELDERLWWASGRTSVVVGARALELITPAARVRASDATYTLDATATRLVVEVRAGVVELSVGEARTQVRAGERKVVEVPPTRDAAHPPPPAHAIAPSLPPATVPSPSPEAGSPRDLPGVQPEATAPRASPPSPATPRPRAERVAHSPATSSALADARHYLGRDDRRAAALADAVVARAPESVEALLVAGDARRRQGLWLEAEQLYRRAIEHPDGAPFLEEASLRRAEARAARGETAAALESLGAARRARTDFLGPERAALEARLHLTDGDDERAYAALLRAVDSTDRVLDTPRLQLARRLARHDRARAAQLLAPLIARGGASADEARALLGTDDTAPLSPRSIR